MTITFADSTKPQQVFLVVVHTTSGATAYAVAKSKKDGPYTISAALSTVEKQVGTQVRLQPKDSEVTDLRSVGS
jgi:hypothetical protein